MAPLRADLRDEGAIALDEAIGCIKKSRVGIGSWQPRRCMYIGEEEARAPQHGRFRHAFRASDG